MEATFESILTVIVYAAVAVICTIMMCYFVWTIISGLVDIESVKNFFHKGKED